MLFCQFPIFLQTVSVKFIPFQKRLQGSPREASFDDTSVDFDRDFVFPVLSVKVRRWMIIVKHEDYYSQKSTDLRQLPNLHIFSRTFNSHYLLMSENDLDIRQHISETRVLQRAYCSSGAAA